MTVDQCLGVTLKKPNLISAWVKNGYKAPIPTRHEIWDHPLGIRVISTVENINNRGIEWHLSISKFPGVYPDQWMEDQVRQDFGVSDFEKDDHKSKVMHLWQPVEKDKRGDCPCKENE